MNDDEALNGLVRSVAGEILDTVNYVAAFYSSDLKQMVTAGDTASEARQEQLKEEIGEVMGRAIEDLTEALRVTEQRLFEGDEGTPRSELSHVVDVILEAVRPDLLLHSQLREEAGLH